MILVLRARSFIKLIEIFRTFPVETGRDIVHLVENRRTMQPIRRNRRRDALFGNDLRYQILSRELEKLFLFSRHCLSQDVLAPARRFRCEKNIACGFRHPLVRERTRQPSISRVQVAETAKRFDRRQSARLRYRTSRLNYDLEPKRPACDSPKRKAPSPRKGDRTSALLASLKRFHQIQRPIYILPPPSRNSL